MASLFPGLARWWCTALLLCAVCVGACSVPAPIACTGMTPPSSLVTSAVLFRVDVYATSSSCSDPGGPSGTPIFTRTFTASAPLSFDVPSGRRPLVLTAYADSAAQQELGRVCTDADFGSGQKVCLDLTLAGADLGTTMSCDPSTPATCGTLTCCDSACRDTSASIEYCGGCRACAATNVAEPTCSDGLCKSTCVTGFGNCIEPAAPAADDGCETDLTSTTQSCGACGRACSSLNTQALACAGGLCTSTCPIGFGNCTKPAAPAEDDGCETATSSTVSDCGACGRACATTNVQTASCTGGLCAPTCQTGYISCKQPAAPLADDGCECAGTVCCAGNTCQLQHANGLGQHFLDCTALATYTDAQALEARNAWGMTAVTDFNNTTSCTDGTYMECEQTLTTCACWGYTGMAPSSGAGHVHLNAVTNGCMCPTAGDPAWN